MTPETLRRELQAVRWAVFGYPPGHRHHEANPILRYYPLAMTILFIVVPAGACIWNLTR